MENYPDKKREQRQPWPLPATVGLWVVLSLIAVIGLSFLLIGSPADWKARPPRDNLQTVQAIVLGLGFVGVVAGAVIGYRRYEVERAKLQHDESQFHAEHKLAIVRSRNERYAQGSQMLAEGATEIRIAGLNIIAGVGNEANATDPFRQMAIDLVCAVIRTQTDYTTSGSQDNFVAKEACRILPTLLPYVDDGPLLGQVPSIDLSNSTIYGLDFGGKVIGNAVFVDAEFRERPNFANARFTGEANFRNANLFHGARYDNCTFFGLANFQCCQADGWVSFSSAQFQNYSYFNAQFQYGADFSEVLFSLPTSFDNSHLANSYFLNTTFNQRATFFRALLERGCRINGATFAESGGFGGALFPGHSGPTDPTFELESEEIEMLREAVFNAEAERLVEEIDCRGTTEWGIPHARGG